jgi:hypothetical protein
MQTRYVGAVISLMSVLTLEIYLIHGYVRYVPFVRQTMFPLNVVAFWTVSVVFAYVLNKAAGTIGRTIEKIAG